MGRKSRAKAARRGGLRAPTPKEELRHALKADRRGRLVGDDPQEWEDVAGAGPRRLAETLIARHTARMDNIEQIPAALIENTLSSLSPITLLVAELRHLGASAGRPPSSYLGTWSDHLAWGVDGVVAATRLALAGQMLGAATLARVQLERWTIHRARLLRVTRQDGEAIADFVARVWTSPDDPVEDMFLSDPDTPTNPLDEADTMNGVEPELTHGHVYLDDGTEICPPVVYGFLSEFMHARMGTAALVWDTDLLDRARVPNGMGLATGPLTDAISLCLRQIRQTFAAARVAAGDEKGARLMLAHPERFTWIPPAQTRPDDDHHSDRSGLRTSGQTHHRTPELPAPGLDRPDLAGLMPLTPEEGLRPQVVAGLADARSLFDEVMAGARPAGRLYRDDEMTTLAFLARRHAWATNALRALDHERHVLGSLDERTITARGGRFILVSELAGLAARWSDSPSASAAWGAVASTIRSAYWLWLDDDDRAMSVLRVTLEQLARARVYRRRPDRAAKLEGRPGTQTRDWLEAAGWKRLRALSRALNEFAHADVGRWSAARQVLIALQPDVDPHEAPYTARGATLELLVLLTARQLTSELVDHPVVADCARELFQARGLPMDEDDRSVDALMNFIWSHSGPARHDADDRDSTAPQAPAGAE